MKKEDIKPNIIVRGPIFPEPVQIIVGIPMGDSIKLIGKGLSTGQVHEPILNAEQPDKLEATPEKEPFDGDASRFRLGIEALRIGLAYEYDPYFSLSISRVDPLPHQLEAVYDYFMVLPRIRFLLADDPGAGKTIMAGLLIKELKIRGLVKRTLIVTPANLSFQWQREMKDKFHENFEVIRSDVLRANYGSNPWQDKNQVVTSLSWVSVIEDAKESLLRSHWDLIIIDEAHKMSAYSSDKKTLAYRLGENLSSMTDHYLLMTATPHKGDPKNFCLFLEDNPTLEWVTPGHPLFECVRDDVLQQVQNDMRRGAVFFDINRNEPSRLDVFSSAIRDGRGNVLHRRLFVVETSMNGMMTIRQPTIFLGLNTAKISIQVPDNTGLPDRDMLEHTLIEQALSPFLEEIVGQRHKEIETITRHTEISLNAIIDRVQCQFADLVQMKEGGSKESGLDGRIKQFEDRLFELNARLERRREELQQERHCTIADIQHYGRAWVLPHPERASPGIAPMVRDDEIERIAVQEVIAFEEARGWKVESVEEEDRGFDLISRKPHPEDPQTVIEVRFIEVKGRTAVGEVALSNNEYKTAQRLKKDYWLYAVFNCSTKPEVNIVQDPVRLGWEPLIKIEHYHVGAEKILYEAKKKVDE